MIGAVIFCFYLIFYSYAYCSEVEDYNDDYFPETPPFEGDMLGFNNSDEVLNPMQRNDENSLEDAALNDESKKWPQGEVYYKISSYFTCKEKCMIHEAMQELETKTCLTFTQDDDRDDFIEIIKSDVCASYVGRQGNRQHLFLSSYCALSIGTVIHEIMHALGFFHEQSRRDRDDYVEVNWDNIAECDRVNFANHSLGNVTTYGLPYDYDSLMHYEPYAFARNEQIKTITPKHGQRIGQRERMSSLDIQRINIHYNCMKKTVAQDRKKNQHGIGSINCRTAEDHCTTWSTNRLQCSNDNQLKKIVKSRCYLNSIQRICENSLEDAALNNESKKVGAIASTKRWPEGEVYYKISHSFTCKEKCMIHEAMQELETKTCLTFTQDDDRDDFIAILEADICGSYVGRQGNRQHLYLSPDCASSISIVIQKIMHALGFFHEQSRRDRDDYVDINWDNIAEIYRLQFVNHGLDNVTTYDLPYDYDSLMHLGPYAFAYNTSIMTIVAKDGRKIGQREKMSDLDIDRINIHYNCMKKTVACIDKSRFCNRTTNVAASCRKVNYERNCQKTCKTCQNLKQNQHKIGSINCRTAEDRCTTWSTNRLQCSDDNQLKKIVKSRCYLSCQLCGP